jgi:hypothetical protein
MVKVDGIRYSRNIEKSSGTDEGRKRLYVSPFSELIHIPTGFFGGARAFGVGITPELFGFIDQPELLDRGRVGDFLVHTVGFFFGDIDIRDFEHAIFTVHAAESDLEFVAFGDGISGVDEFFVDHDPAFAASGSCLRARFVDARAVKPDVNAKFVVVIHKEKTLKC